MKKLKIITTTMICILIGIISVKAETVNYTYKEYRIQYYSLGQGTTAWNSWTTFGTSSSLASGYGLKTIAIRLGYTTGFVAGTTYRVVIDTGISPSNEKQYVLYDQTSCYGSQNMTNWDPQSNYISECEYVGTNDTPNSVHRKYVYDITPSANVQGIQFNIQLGGTAEIGSVNVYNTTTITTGPDITGAIDEQTLIIEDGFQDIKDKITEANENLINAITENNEVCELYDKNSIQTDNSFLQYNGNIGTANSWGITNYIKIDLNTQIIPLRIQNGNVNYCFYNINKVIISCNRNDTMILNSNLTIPTDSSYVRFSINKNDNLPQMQICKQQGQAITDILGEDNNYTMDPETHEIIEENETLEDTLNEYLNIQPIDFDIHLDSTVIAYIWEIFESICMVGWSQWIILSMLSIGLIRMVLDR